MPCKYNYVKKKKKCALAQVLRTKIIREVCHSKVSICQNKQYLQSKTLKTIGID